MAYFALIKLHRLPHEIFTLPEHELAMIYAFVDEYIKACVQIETQIERGAIDGNTAELHQSSGWCQSDA